MEGLPLIGDVRVEPEPLSPGARAVRSASEIADVCLVYGPVGGTVPEGYPPLAGAWGAVWHVRARGPVPSFRLSAALDQVPASCTAAPDEGQHLCAVSIDDGTTELTIGGEDAEALWRRSRAADLIPRWWARLPQLPGDAERDSDGLVTAGALDHARGVFWDLPGLEPGEECVVHVAVAWSARDVERPSTWYAVDVSTRRLLEELVSRPRGVPGSRPSRPGPSA
ncbi:MAG: hypothetical protein K0S43_3586 [Cellulosimicrobium sp.]|nr:hypothetical protein [Cellulosimicrobium sp.]